jgi:hypothetical protein
MLKKRQKQEWTKEHVVVLKRYIPITHYDNVLHAGPPEKTQK